MPNNQPPPQPTTIRVWDIFVRLFHWSLVVSVTLASVTGFVMGASWITLHLIAGGVAFFLVLARIIWGFTGSPYARFSEFVRGPATMIQHFKELRANTAPRHIGHNPLGGAMVLALIGFVIGLGLTGLVVLGGSLKIGPLAGFSFATGDMVQDVHQAMAVLLLLLIVAHLGGVVFETMRTDENLVKAMLDGTKETLNSHPSDAPTPPRAKPILAVVLCAILSGPLVFWLMQDKSAAISHPPIPVAQFNQNYATECADCHKAYHPSLLPAQSWVKLMSGLDNHFGEDASLDASTTAEITAWLQTVSAEQADTKPAHKFRVTDPANPIAISQTPFWRKIHHEVGEDGTFTRAPIYTKSNCSACHSDAAQGWFSPSQINIPKLPKKDTAQ